MNRDLDSARQFAAAEWDELNLDQYDEAEFIKTYPTLTKDGWPQDEDPLADDAAKYLVSADTERAEWIEQRAEEILASWERRTA